MAITALTLNKTEKGFEVSFKATDGKDYTALLQESKYGLFMLNDGGVVSMYKLTGLASVFDGGIKKSDELDLQGKLVSNNFDGDVKVVAYDLYGGVFVSANGKIRYGQTELIQCTPKEGKFESEWIGEGDVTFADPLDASILTRVRSSNAKPWREQNTVSV